MLERVGIADSVYALLKKDGLNNLQSKAFHTNRAAVVKLFDTVKVDNKPSGDFSMRFKKGGIWWQLSLAEVLNSWLSPI